VNHTPSFD